MRHQSGQTGGRRGVATCPLTASPRQQRAHAQFLTAWGLRVHCVLPSLALSPLPPNAISQPARWPTLQPRPGLPGFPPFRRPPLSPPLLPLGTFKPLPIQSNPKPFDFFFRPNSNTCSLPLSKLLSDVSSTTCICWFTFHFGVRGLNLLFFFSYAISFLV